MTLLIAHEPDLYKRKLKEALNKFVDYMDELVFEEDCSEGTRIKIIESYMELRAVMREDALSELRKCLEEHPEYLEEIEE